MTLPDERYRALMQAREFLLELCDPKKSKRVPLEVRHKARVVMRHFPDPYFVRLLSESHPDILKGPDEPLDPVYKMVKEYDLEKTKNI